MKIINNLTMKVKGHTGYVHDISFGPSPFVELNNVQFKYIAWMFLH